MDGYQLVAARTAGAISSAYLDIESDTAPERARPVDLSQSVRSGL